jgi:hypothetical protein
MDKKLIIAATMLLIATFLFGTIYWPENSFMLFAGDGLSFTIVRALSLVTLGILLVTNPPRKLWVRRVIGGAALLTLTLAIDMALSYTLPIADAALMVQASIILGIEALEIQPKPVQLTKRATKSVA